VALGNKARIILIESVGYGKNILCGRRI